MTQVHRAGIIIGRFQPLHKHHLEKVIVPALKQCDTLIILLGSSKRPRTPKDPWTNENRTDMIKLGLRDMGYDFNYPDFSNAFHFKNNDKQIFIIPIRDSLYSNTQWQLNVQEKVREITAQIKHNLLPPFKDIEISLFGVDRDESTFYLDFFPQWQSKILTMDGAKDEVNGTMCRDLIFSNDMTNTDEWKDLVSPSVRQFILNWIQSPPYADIKSEYDFLEKYRNEMRKFKYPLIFQTADNIILWKGHILLANRRSYPGKGLWSMPGGFIDVNKTLQQSAIDNAREKTKLNLKPEWLLNCKTFDHPKRSLRGRTITTTFLWKLPDSFSFDVEAGKNTNKVQWFEFCEVMQMSDSLYEDHYDIIIDMLSTVK